jgi:hypothetical protein
MKAQKHFFLASLASFVMLLGSNIVLSQICEGAHSTSIDDSWLSCVETENPNPDRSEGHWILYDFGDYYELNQSYFWNYNVMGETSRGVANMVVDWSIDGTSWNWWGDINLEEAPGSDSYFGEPGPDFEGLVVRYLLLSVTSNHGGNCYGFSELRLDVNPGVVDIEEISLAAFEFGLHPNPARNHATLQLEAFIDTRVRLYSLDGKIILSYSPISATSKLDLTNLASGLYTVEVIDNSGARATQRLTVIQ